MPDLAGPARGKNADSRVTPAAGLMNRGPVASEMIRPFYFEFLDRRRRVRMVGLSGFSFRDTFLIVAKFNLFSDPLDQGRPRALRFLIEMPRRCLAEPCGCCDRLPPFDFDQTSALPAGRGLRV